MCVVNPEPLWGGKAEAATRLVARRTGSCVHGEKQDLMGLHPAHDAAQRGKCSARIGDPSSPRLSVCIVVLFFEDGEDWGNQVGCSILI